MVLREENFSVQLITSDSTTKNPRRIPRRIPLLFPLELLGLEKEKKKRTRERERERETERVRRLPSDDTEVASCRKKRKSHREALEEERGSLVKSGAERKLTEFEERVLPKREHQKARVCRVFAKPWEQPEREESRGESYESYFI